MIYAGLMLAFGWFLFQAGIVAVAGVVDVASRDVSKK